MAGKENILLRKEVSIYNVYSKYQLTGHVECKHKHMMKSGAPPDRVGVLHHLLPIEFHGFTSIMDF